MVRTLSQKLIACLTAFLCVLTLSSVASAQADSCFLGASSCTGPGAPQACCTGYQQGASCQGGAPCSLPCPSPASTTYEQIAPPSQARTTILICDLDAATTLYAIFGTTLLTPTWNYGQPIPPGRCENFGINPPNPNANVHTVTTQIGVITQSGTAACSFFDKSN